MAPAQALENEALTRPMGSSEENWSKAMALGTGLAIFSITLRRLVELSQVAQACREIMDQHAILRSQIVENSKGKYAFLVKRDPVIPNVVSCPWPKDDNIRRCGVGDITIAGDDDLAMALNKVIHDEINTPFVNSERNTTPPLDVFEVHLYTETCRSQSIIVFRFHGGGTDRPSSYAVVQQFLTSLNALVDGQTAPLPHNPGKDVILPALEELIPKGKASKNFFQRGIDTVGYALSVNKYALLPFKPNYGEQKKEPLQSEIFTRTLGRAGTACILTACKKNNTTLAAALGAAFLKTAASCKELKEKRKDEFSFTSLVDCRKYFEPALPVDTVGNYVSGIPQSQQVKEGVSLWNLALSLSITTEKELAKSKQFSEIPVLNMLFSQVLKHPGVTPQASLRTALFSLFVDETPINHWSDADKLQIAAVCGPFPSMHGIGPCFAICDTLLDGIDLSISLVYPNQVYSRAQMEAFAASAMDLLDAVSQDVC